jgi:hypothetical protein
MKVKILHMVDAALKESGVVVFARAILVLQQ